MGHPHYKSNDKDRGILRTMLGASMATLEDVALVIGVHKSTLYKHYQEEIASSKPEGISRVAASL
ncbi:MAG: hypothetical protein DRI46_12100, partial [Chloroflexi bacterium]